MAIDVRQLRPSMLTRMLNSTPLGEVLGDRQLRRHRNRAGYRIGDEKHVDLLRYAAWLLWNRHNPEPEREPRDYEAMKEAARARNAELSAIGRDIGEIPEVIDPDRKARAATDFRFFCEAYFPETFSLPWSDDHLKVIAKIETAVIALMAGGLLWLLNRLYAAKPAWQAFEGTIIAAVKWAEKEIPDDTPNKAFNRLNAALNYVLKVYEDARGNPADAQTKNELREGIQIVHAELEASGNLDGHAPAEAAG